MRKVLRLTGDVIDMKPMGSATFDDIRLLMEVAPLTGQALTPRPCSAKSPRPTHMMAVSRRALLRTSRRGPCAKLGDSTFEELEPWVFAFGGEGNRPLSFGDCFREVARLRKRVR